MLSRNAPLLLKAAVLSKLHTHSQIMVSEAVQMHCHSLYLSWEIRLPFHFEVNVLHRWFYDVLWGGLHIYWCCQNVHLISNSSFSGDTRLAVNTYCISCHSQLSCRSIVCLLTCVWFVIWTPSGDIIKCYMNDMLAYQLKPPGHTYYLW